MEPNQNGHSHAQPIQTITVTIDPNHGKFNYNCKNIDLLDAIGKLEFAKLLMYEDLRKTQTSNEAAHEPR